MPKGPEHIKDLKPDKRNARRHNPRNIGMIVDALHEVGAARSIVIDEDDQVIAGNGTIEAAAEAGITKLKVVEADGNTIVAVRRRNLTDEQKRRLALYDNRTAELAEWDPDIMRALNGEPGALDGMFSPEELADMLQEQQAKQVEPIKVERQTDVAWILIAIPLSEWPKHQGAVEQLQAAGIFTTTALRPEGDTDENKA